MLTVNCPNCGAEVVFRSPALPVKVCGYCRTAVTRIDDGVRAAGEMAVLPFDVSPIRIGTRGSFDGQGFEVIGRVRWAWSDGAWNEWLLLFADGRDAWLGEAMGQFMLLFEKPLKGSLARVVSRLAQGGDAVIGEDAAIDGIDYQVADIKDATCVACEGELPFAAPAGWTVKSVDFRSATGACASFQHDGTEASLYTGRYVLLAELKPQDLRPLDGWTIPVFAA
jgi:endogenous inhibitor of DNA gyrase (YacG/DUF329 family)